jgi:exopolyphosphatase/guanosine-5'-triphosphate,3'-diphosphate pyrophosphatase
VKLGTIDVGTNTTLLLVAEGSGPRDVRVLDERAEITRLGRGIGSDGRLGRAGIDRTLAVLGEYAAIARGHGAPLRAIGTEALRRAPNAAEFLEPAAALLGTAIEVIDGAREAALTFAAAVTSFPEIAARPIVVIDIGGGSTEVIVSEGGQVRSRVSLPLGSVRLTERFVRNDPPGAAEVAALNAEIAGHLRDLPQRPAGDGAESWELIGTAGTVTTLAAMALGLGSYDPDRVHGHRLARAALQSQIDRLAHAAQAERETMAGLDPRRADVILAGAHILRAFVDRLDVASVLVNDRGIRWGLLYEGFAPDGVGAALPQGGPR